MSHNVTPMSHTSPMFHTSLQKTCCVQEPSLLENADNHRSKVADLSTEIDYLKNQVGEKYCI